MLRNVVASLQCDALRAMCSLRLNVVAKGNKFCEAAYYAKQHISRPKGVTY